MEKDSTAAPPAAIPSAAELEFRRYEARLGVWKVVLGTFIVGLAGVLIPGAVSFYSAYFENVRKETELRISQQAAHQQYIKDFFATAINQDIELRLRFADYFANLSGPGQEQLWKDYYFDLKALRDNNRKKINDLEKQLVDFKKSRRTRSTMPSSTGSIANWPGPMRKSAMCRPSAAPSIALADSSPIGKKMRLYKETTDLVQRLASGSGPLVERVDDLARFWNLYRKDLIGVESRRVRPGHDRDRPSAETLVAFQFATWLRFEELGRRPRLDIPPGIGGCLAGRRSATNTATAATTNTAAIVSRCEKTERLPTSCVGRCFAAAT